MGTIVKGMKVDGAAHNTMELPMAHSHSHDHGPPVGASSLTRAFVLGIIANLIYVLVEAGYGLSTGSMSLVSDAAHNFSDVIALLLSLYAFIVSKRPATASYTYGLKKSTILVSLLNAVFLFLALGALTLESISRLGSATRVPGDTIAAVSGFGIVVNITSALLFFKSQKTDVNVRGAYLHLLADALVSLGVFASGIVIQYTAAFWIDPVVSLAVVLVVIFSAFGLFRSSLKLSLDAVPEGVSLDSLREASLKVRYVQDVHHIHVWPLSTTENALTAHVVIGLDVPISELDGIKHDLKHVFEHHNIHHSTVEFEIGECAKPDC